MDSMIYDPILDAKLDIHPPTKHPKKQQKKDTPKENAILTKPLISGDLAKIIQEKFSNLPLTIKKKKNKKPLKIVCAEKD